MNSLSVNGILLLSFVMYTIERQFSREDSFFHACDEGQIFNFLRSDSMAVIHVCGRVFLWGRFQSDRLPYRSSNCTVMVFVRSIARSVVEKSQPRRHEAICEVATYKKTKM